VSDDVPASLGLQLRRTRIALRRRQLDLAASANVSQATVSRVELGRGGPVSMATWIRIPGSLGMEFRVVPHQDARDRLAIQRRCHQLVVELSRLGQWSAITLLDGGRPECSETVLERNDRHEVAVIRVWDLITDVERAVADLGSSVERERASRGEAWQVSGAVIIARSALLLRRMSEGGRAVDLAFPVRGARWLAALTGDRPIPPAPGMIWTDFPMTRLRPFVRYLDHRQRKHHRQRPRRGAT
jgi:transcriptional regulator with XRE-family HTH domain